MRQTKTRVMGALHAEAAKRGLSHQDLSERAGKRYGFASMADLDDGQLRDLFLDLTGRVFHPKHPGMRNRQRRKAAGTAGRKNAINKVVEMAATVDVEMVYQLAYGLGWTQETIKTFIRRQLGGRDQLRTMADINKVLWGLKAIAKRKKSGASHNVATKR